MNLSNVQKWCLQKMASKIRADPLFEIEEPSWTDKISRSESCGCQFIVERNEEALCVSECPKHWNGAPATVGGMKAVGGNRREQLLITRLRLGHTRLNGTMNLIGNVGHVNVNVE